MLEERGAGPVEEARKPAEGTGRQVLSPINESTSKHHANVSDIDAIVSAVL